MFETKGSINREALQEITKWLMPKISRYATIFGVLLGCFVIAFSIWAQYPIGIVCGIVFIIVFIGLRRFIKAKIVDTTLGRMKDLYGCEALDEKVWFEDEQLVVQKIDADSKTEIKYDVLARFETTPHYFLFFTKSEILVIVHRACLTKQEETLLLEFLKTKPTQIDWEIARNMKR